MIKPNPENCAQLSYITQHGAVLIVFLLNLQASITAQILCTGGEEVCLQGSDVQWHDVIITVAVMVNVCRLLTVDCETVVCRLCHALHTTATFWSMMKMSCMFFGFPLQIRPSVL